MLDLVIINGLVVTQNENRDIKQANIGINKGKIEYIGEEILPSKKIIDAKDYVILPAFLNGHIHFGEYYLRGYKNSLTTEKYILLGEKFYNTFKDINEEIRNSSIKNVLLESIQNGTLTVLGVRGWPIVQEFPVNAYLGYPLMNSNKLDNYKIDFKKRFNLLEKSSNVEYFLGLHSVKWIEENTLKDISTFFKENKQIKLSLHISETFEEVQFIKNKYGITPVQLLDRYNLLNERTLLVHCNYLDDNDIELLKQKNVSVAICHNSNLKLQNKPCDVKKMLNNGINVLVATDGPATNDSLSLLDSLKTTALLTNLDSITLLDMITVNPAKHMEINSGSIIEGNKADLIMYNINSLNMTYMQSIIENLIYTSGNKPEIVIKDGNVIIENYLFKNKIEYDIIQEKKRIIELIENKKI